MLAACSCLAQEESAGTNDVAGIYTRERYELIVDRAPFGTEPLVDETKQEAAAAKALEKDYRLCFLMESNDGEVRAGFQNKKAAKGQAKSVVLREGESYGTLKLLNIDLPNSSATLLYKGLEVPFKLERAKVAAAKPAAKPAQPAQPAQPSRRFGGGFRRTTPPPEPVAKPEPPQMTAEEIAIQREQVQQNLREYQMEVLRQGMPPLPVQLTPEQDDQLVQEGVLPPIEQEVGYE
jgi:hypothetical protein